MKLSSIKPETIVRSQIIVDNPSFILLYPDTNLTIQETIYNTNLLLNNCRGIISPNIHMRYYNKRIDGKKHAVRLKQELTSNNEKGNSKKIQVFNSLPFHSNTSSNQNKTSKFYLYDMSIHTFGLKKLYDANIANKVLTQTLFENINLTFDQIKTHFPTYNIETIFFINSDVGALYNILNDIKKLLPKRDLEKYSFFDNLAFASNFNTMFPLFEKKNGKPQLIIKNHSKLSSLIKPEETKADNHDVIDVPASTNVQDLEKTEPEDIFEPDIDVKTKFIQNINTNIDNKNVVSINTQQLKNVLKDYKITDPTILANTKVAVDYYNQTKGIDEKLKDENLLNVILKSINYTIHGDDEVNEEYLHNPQLLINKIKDIKTYQVPLMFPNNDHIIDPKDIIDIKHTTGQFRQKFEYTETVHDNVKSLFSTIENLSNHPVKVKKIDYEIKDNDRDRIIHYKVTLKNLSGQNKEPYTVELKVPSIVNDRYFKLHSNTYIQSIQQILKPVSKTDKSEVRLLSNYAIIHVRIKNIKFNPADISQLINYLKVKYSHLISISDYVSYIKFKDDSVINFNDNTIYKSNDKKIFIDENNQIKDDNDNNIKYGKNELIFEIIRSKIQEDNPEDKLTTTKKNVPYLEIYLSGISMPLILYLWHEKGLLKALTDLEIDYEIIKEQKDRKSNQIIISMSDGQFVACTYTNLREELLLNGILASKVKNISPDLDNPEIIDEHISNLYGSRSLVKINLITENQIDPITKQLLDFENMSTSFPDLVSNDMLDVLLNKKEDSLADLSIYRSRLSELVLNLMYKQIKMAHNKYKSETDMGIENSKIYLDPNFIINSLLSDTSSLLQHTEPYNPLDEIMLSSRTVKTGKGVGGVPKQQAFKTQHRNIHESQYGNLGAVSTPEHQGVGLTLHHTLTPVISNKWGSYGGKDITKLSGWNILTLDEALILFQSSMDSDRACMARAHANQVTPINNSEAPLITTGAEFLVGQLASKRFVEKSKSDGKIEKIEDNKYVIVKYNDGSQDSFDLVPRMSKTKRGSTLPLKMIVDKKEGDKVEKNEIVARTKSFDDSGIYTSGKNVFIAIMNYQGYSHEDAYVVSQELADETTTDIVKEVHTVIPPDAKLIDVMTESGKMVSSGDVLLEFAYDRDIDDYISTYIPAETDEISDEEFESDEGILYSQGQNTIKLLASISGEIIDFKIYINNKNSTDNKIVNLHKQLVAKDQELIKVLQQNKSKNEKKEAIDNIKTDYMRIGGHKLKGGKEYEGAKIVYYIKYQKPLNVGDKIANRSALKGVISRVLKETPKGSFVPKIDVFASPIGVFARKNMSILKELYLGKIFYYLNIKVKEMANDSKIKTDSIIDFILNVYEPIATEKIYKAIKKKINNQSQSKLRTHLSQGKQKLFFTIEPFTNVTFDQIKKSAKIMNIPLDEKVYIPELDMWTKEAVPVGVAYYQFLEHHSDVYSNIRGAEKYVGLTRAPTRGKSQQGGQSISNLDINALITLEANNILHEFFTFRSDEHKSKRESYSQIMETGELVSLPTKDTIGGTHHVFDIYMTSLGLQMKN